MLNNSIAYTFSELGEYRLRFGFDPTKRLILELTSSCHFCRQNLKIEINYTETFRDTYKYHAICMFQFRQVLLYGKSYSFYVSRFSYYSFAGSTGYIPLVT